ncbi:hypothetical protein J3R83DRAFT_11501 [Lanmaoa asiatica]|nr:hypothetical protein J3R83DRAFT_11501 [Lanmaoa asiatica]
MDLFAYIDRTEPGSPSSATPTSVTPFENPSRSFSQRKELGRAVYKERFLGTVTQSILASKREVARVAKAMLTRLLDDSQARAPEKIKDGTEVVVMSVTSFTSGGHRAGVHRRSTDVSIPVITVDVYPPHPPYESCPPISRSVLVDVTHEHTLPFLPYADDDRFPTEEYQANFNYLEWETPFDPDVEMIQIETVRRLHSMHEIDTQEIDRMSMFKEFRHFHNTGLLWEQSQRDVLHWPGAFRFQENREEQLPVYTPDPDDLRQRLMSNLRAFCPSINCLHSVCETHGQMHVSSYIPSRKPQMTGQDMILSEGVPCGSNCFRHIQDFERFMSHHAGSIDTLETILGIAPDLFPCQLAIICLKPCKQVFVQRLQLFPDHTILPFTDAESSHLQQRRRGKRKPKFACAHSGSCTSNHCPCYVKKQHCSLMCRCGVKCERQWPSCNCANGRCLSTCPCAKNGRECIPGICISCDAGPCDNTRIQRLASKSIEIKCGTYGLGAFACQTMDTNVFLGTYVGHILNHELADPLIELTKYTSRNYLFDVSQQDSGDTHLPILDAAHLGNATRFLNHMADGKDNVEGRKKKVKEGEELFLDYGAGYWKDSK